MNNLTAAPVTQALIEVARVADAFLAAQRRRADVIEDQGGWDYETGDDQATRHALEDEWLAALRRVERAIPVGSSEWATHGILRHEIESSVARRVCHPELWDLNQLTGWHMVIGRTALLMPVDTAPARERALRMFRSLPRMLGVRQDNLRRGLATGYIAARHAVQRVIEQLTALLTSDLLELPVHRVQDDAFAEAWRGLVDEHVRPGLERFREYLVDSYMPAARTAAGIWALPDGDLCYRAEVLHYTSLDLSPEELLEGVEEEIAAIDAQLTPIIRRLYGAGLSLSEGKRALRSDERFVHIGSEEMIAHARAALERVQPHLSRYFLHVPEVPLRVEAMTPVEEQTGASAYYQSPEGSRPGRYVINTRQPQIRSRFDTTCSALHEGVPGHHFERAYGDTRTTRHPATREMMTQATREGWAYYSLWLCDDMGMYEADAERAGYYLQFLDTWVGLWADVNLHTRGAQRERLIDALVRHSGRPREIATANIDRFMAAPGHMTCYMVGFRELRGLRAHAEAALGGAFDARVFHDVLLRDGPVTLSMQRAKVQHWIDESTIRIGG